MKRILYILLLFPVIAYGQNVDYRYNNQYCIVTDKKTGEIVVSEYITSGRVETQQNITRAETLNDVKNSALSSALPSLPSAGGYVEKDKLYKYGTEIVQAVQSHYMTVYDPKLTPALFSFYRPEASDMTWIENEKVGVGTVRIHKDVKYTCLQSHMTLKGWEPDKVTGVLWSVVPAGTEWKAGVVYKVGDIVTYSGSIYTCLQAHTSISTWYPSAVPALWKKQAK